MIILFSLLKGMKLSNYSGKQIHTLWNILIYTKPLTILVCTLHQCLYLEKPCYFSQLFDKVMSNQLKSG